MKKTLLAINPDGSIIAIYDDALAGLLSQGETTRASHVEPCKQGGWHAIMVDTKDHLGPFPLRAQALAAEISYLEKQLFGLK